MAAVDTLFDSPYEQTIALVDSSLWMSGSIHKIHARGKDAAGNWGHAHSVTVEGTPAAYKFMGFLPPIANDGSSSFNLGSTVPVKFQLTDANGNPAYHGRAWLMLSQSGSLVYPTPSGKSNTGNEFRFDETEGIYIYNLSTKGLAKGIWELAVTTEYNEIFEVFIKLK
jgi:hypothetical protein